MLDYTIYTYLRVSCKLNPKTLNHVTLSYMYMMYEHWTFAAVFQM